MIKWFSEIGENDFGLVGGKGLNLSKIFNHGIKVPDGFVVTSIAYDMYVKENQLKEKIDEILANNSSLLEKSRNIKSLFQKANFPSDLKQQILNEAGKLGSGGFAVRSSSTAEDLPGISFAGQYSSYLNVSMNDLIEKVVLCWQSLWNDRAIEYRSRSSLTKEFTQSVVIQEMVEASLAGVVFSANPINGIRDEMVINASYGLGESIVSGRVNPDQYTVHKKKGIILKKEIAFKELLCRYSYEGVEYVPVEEEHKSASSLNKDHIKAITDVVIKIEDYYGKPQDIEFAFDKEDKLYILQSRSITTLFPVDNLDHDEKLRAYLSAGTVLLGMKEPMTPLGFDMLSQMFPTIINVMTMKKKPMDNSFVKYAGCRAYVDMTYMLSNKFVSKKFAKAFSGNDLPLEDVMINMIEKHGDVFRRQGIKFRIPLGVVKYGLGMISQMRIIKQISNEKRYDAIIQTGEEVYNKLIKSSENLRSLEEKVGFIDQCMSEAFILSQKQGLYCTEFTYFKKIKKVIERKFGNQYNVEQLTYSLPNCITQEFTIKMNKAAEYFDNNNIEPTAEHFYMREIIEKFGHRSSIELDFGNPRWSENPEYIINQIKKYMTNKMYVRNLGDISERSRRAEGLIEEVYERIKSENGDKKADRLKKMMINYRIAAGMREYPKYDIVRVMTIARSIMLEVGEEFFNEGLINDKHDIFYLFKEDILNKDNLKEKIEDNKYKYQFEMKRTSIPRIVLNTGETFYSAQKINPNTKLIQGMPLSPGVYEGTIRLVFNPTDTELQEGEIMVTESTNPAWTPLFAVAKGLIMEYGGPMSHGGIVAREFGIPAVVGVSSASSILKDGQRVRINGETGIIEIL